MTTARALTIAALASVLGGACATDRFPDLAGLVLLLGLAAFAVMTPHIDDRMSR